MNKCNPLQHPVKDVLLIYNDSLSGQIPKVLCYEGSRYLDPDGTFPNHSPNPEDKEAMKAGSEAVQQSGSDLGIVVDTVRTSLH